MNFDTAFDLLLTPTYEGGYSNDLRDPGGETKYGISKRSYPHLDIKTLTRAQVKPIYRADFWGPAGCDAVPDELKYPLFDFAVNSGPKTAVRTLQTRLQVEADGIIGPKTLLEIGLWPPRDLALVLCLDRLVFMTNRKNWPAHGKGWSRRICSLGYQLLEVRPNAAY
ncbi:MAG TPA: glycosyl hydrolase 108 family protein [Anaerolineales bacterium]|nr:glycosyl hydrolase 108 family protein [Anaerolineales bacterium]